MDQEHPRVSESVGGVVLHRVQVSRERRLEKLDKTATACHKAYTPFIVFHESMKSLALCPICMLEWLVSLYDRFAGNVWTHPTI